MRVGMGWHLRLFVTQNVRLHCTLPPLFITHCTPVVFLKFNEIEDRHQKLRKMNLKPQRRLPGGLFLRGC